MGRIKIQLLGFGMLTAIFVIISVAYPYVIARPILFLVLYGLAQFFFNFGPNSTTVRHRVYASYLRTCLVSSSSFQEKSFPRVGVRLRMVSVRPVAN